MSVEKVPISVQICTLNEEDNILDCITKVLANNPEEIIVIDGASDDRTLEIIKEYPIKIINAGRIGLAKQRQMGIEATVLPYIALVDADDRLETGCLQKLLNEAYLGNYKAIQAKVLSFANSTYWQTAWGLYCSVNINHVGDTNIVGRPAVFDRLSICEIGFDMFFTYGSEDTDISYRFQKAGLKQGIGTGISLRIHPASFEECKQKWISYGRGYARFIFKHKERTFNIFKHLFWGIPIKRSFNTLKQGYFRFIPFFFLYAFFCQVGFFYEIILLLKGQRISDFGR
jgi:glycosyltransferase involved in cell wall biosynthesis